MQQSCEDAILVHGFGCGFTLPLPLISGIGLGAVLAEVLGVTPIGYPGGARVGGPSHLGGYAGCEDVLNVLKRFRSSCLFAHLLHNSTMINTNSNMTKDFVFDGLHGDSSDVITCETDPTGVYGRDETVSFASKKWFSTYIFVR